MLEVAGTDGLLMSGKMMVVVLGKEGDVGGYDDRNLVDVGEGDGIRTVASSLTAPQIGS